MEDKTAAGIIGEKELAAFFENLGMMVQAGISVSEAVSLLKEDSGADKGVFAAALDSMNESLMSGSSLASAMKISGAFPQYATDIIDTAEYTGRLEETLFHLSSYYDTEMRMKTTLFSSLRYPVILLLMIMAVLAALLIMVFPSFYGVYSKLTGSLSESSFSYINISFALCRVMLVFLAILAAAALAGVLAWKQGKHAKVIGFLSQFSSFREMLESLYLYRFTSSFGMFIAAGENQDSALERSLPTVGDGVLRAKLESCRNMMAEGKTFAQAAFEEKLYDRAGSRTLIAAERSGMLDRAIDRITEDLRNTAERRANDIADTAEPVMTGSMMIFIGLILISIMLPLIGIMNSIG